MFGVGWCLVLAGRCLVSLFLVGLFLFGVLAFDRW